MNAGKQHQPIYIYIYSLGHTCEHAQNVGEKKKRVQNMGSLDKLLKLSQRKRLWLGMTRTGRTFKHRERDREKSSEPMKKDDILLFYSVPSHMGLLLATQTKRYTRTCTRTRTHTHTNWSQRKDETLLVFHSCSHFYIVYKYNYL